MFIKKIFEKKVDDSVHQEFVKFSKGEFKNKFLLEGKKQASKWSIKTSVEFTNSLVKLCLEKAPEKLKIKGIIVSTLDVESDIKFEIKDVKKFMGIRKIIIDTEANKADILELMNKQPRVFYALSFETPSSQLKIKEKLPKSGKPSSKGEKEPKADFCTLKTTDQAIVKEIFFDNPIFKEIKINHTLKITDIIMPKGEEDFAKIRLLAKRKGKLIRNIIADGKKLVKETDFIV